MKKKTKEILDILKETNTSVVNNPESNMANAVGVAPVIKMIDKGIRVGMGTDGIKYDKDPRWEMKFRVYQLGDLFWIILSVLCIGFTIFAIYQEINGNWDTLYLITIISAILSVTFICASVDYLIDIKDCKIN